MESSCAGLGHARHLRLHFHTLGQDDAELITELITPWQVLGALALLELPLLQFHRCGASSPTYGESKVENNVVLQEQMWSVKRYDKATSGSSSTISGYDTTDQGWS